MYKLYKYNNDVVGAYKQDGELITMFTFKDTDNTDYANFKKDLADGAELQDSEGVVMTAEQVNQFIETLA
jgi:hypothetical protein